MSFDQTEEAFRLLLRVTLALGQQYTFGKKNRFHALLEAPFESHTSYIRGQLSFVGFLLLEIHSYLDQLHTL